ncbi:hypothetical protein [Synechococcus sp. WH 8101]|uniref:hypothetical protein n=1 Tax=Synechococcus sp. WH 8101 TaxID=59932 RepID=UPI00102386D9|nr:hypothetical protein [Synechococcus sp. WH 8101]
MNQRRKVHKLLILLAILLTSCSTVNQGKSLPEVKDTEKVDQSIQSDEERFLFDEDHRNKILNNCDSNEEVNARTSYGIWSKHNSCYLRLNNIEIGKIDILTHKSNQGDVDAFRFMIFPDTAYGKRLLKNYPPHEVVKNRDICIRYYQSTLPILIVAKDSLCEALHYKQI